MLRQWLQKQINDAPEEKRPALRNVIWLAGIAILLVCVAYGFLYLSRALHSSVLTTVGLLLFAVGMALLVAAMATVMFLQAEENQ